LSAGAQLLSPRPSGPWGGAGANCGGLDFGEARAAELILFDACILYPFHLQSRARPGIQVEIEAVAAKAG
jgi:hypothetical protein